MYSFFCDDTRYVSGNDRAVYLSEINLCLGPELILQFPCTKRTGIRLYLPFLFGLGKAQCNYYDTATNQQEKHWGKDNIFLFSPVRPFLAILSTVAVIGLGVLPWQQKARHR